MPQCNAESRDVATSLLFRGAAMALIDKGLLGRSLLCV